MKQPPFSIINEALNLCMEISSILGELNVSSADKPSVQLRKQNRIKTIQSSLAIEGNTLSTEQITAILENKIVLGPANDILEVKNALEAYEYLHDWNYQSINDFKHAHKLLLQNIIKEAGQWRKGNVGIFAGKEVAHVAPPAKKVQALMADLFGFLKQKDDISLLVKSCVFHYELEFIHPFADGNGRMGRLWQQLILMDFNPLFEYTAIESLIKENQQAYYDVLAACDREGESTQFIVFMLRMILSALNEYVEIVIPTSRKATQRLEEAKHHFQENWFSRKDYLLLCKSIASATASRDLASAAANNLLEKKGSGRLTLYRFSNEP